LLHFLGISRAAVRPLFQGQSGPFQGRRLAIEQPMVILTRVYLRLKRIGRVETAQFVKTWNPICGHRTPLCSLQTLKSRHSDDHVVTAVKATKAAQEAAKAIDLTQIPQENSQFSR
jgi:hypothetical protein